jgi:hypothetical protein
MNMIDLLLASLIMLRNFFSVNLFASLFICNYYKVVLMSLERSNRGVTFCISVTLYRQLIWLVADGLVFYIYYMHLFLHLINGLKKYIYLLLYIYSKETTAQSRFGRAI